MELEQHAISLDVKLAFNRLVSLIYTLKDDIGQVSVTII